MLAVAGLWLLRRHKSWRETLLLSFVGVPIVFFALWPVKGFQYLLPTAAPLAILAGRTLAGWVPDRSADAPKRRRQGSVAVLMTVVVLATLAVPSWHRIHPTRSGAVLAGSGGVPGGREAGRWIADTVPKGAELMTLGPSMANIIEFYGHRRAYGLSVSPNPLHRNPSYSALSNPDLAIRNNDLQYIVWDSFSASRSTFFAEKLLEFVHKYNGRAVHTETVMATGPDGRRVAKPVITIYEVRP